MVSKMWVHVNIHVHVHVYTDAYVHTYVYTHMYIQMNTYIFIYIHIYIYVYMYIYIYVHICICSCTRIQYHYNHACTSTLYIFGISNNCVHLGQVAKPENMRTLQMRGLQRIKKFAYSTNSRWNLFLQHAWSCGFLLERALFAGVAQEWDACQYIRRVRVGNTCWYMCKSSCNLNAVLECVSIHMVSMCTLQERNACQ